MKIMTIFGREDHYTVYFTCEPAYLLQTALWEHKF